MLTGAAASTLLSGEGGNDVLDASAHNNVLTLTLSGGTGNDIFVVRTTNVSIANTGNAGSGHDRVETDLSGYNLPEGVEDLEYFGTVSFSGTGNNAANVIVGGIAGDSLLGLAADDILAGEGGNDMLDGGGGNDRLIGGAGSDTMNGGADNDTLLVDNRDDVANGGDGVDTVEIVAVLGVAHSIAADVETVTARVTAAVIGNALDNLFGGRGWVRCVQRQ